MLWNWLMQGCLENETKWVRVVSLETLFTGMCGTPCVLLQFSSCIAAFFLLYCWLGIQRLRKGQMFSTDVDSNKVDKVVT